MSRIPPRALRIALAVLAVAAAWWAVRRTPAAAALRSLPELRAELDRWRPWDRIAYVAVYIAAAAAGFPGVIVSAAGATLYGMAQGSALTLLAGNLAAWPPFLLARWAARPPDGDPRADRLAMLARRHGFAGVLALRLVPVPYNLVNFLCGAAGCRVSHYFWGTALGMIPGTIVYQYLFSRWGEDLALKGFRWSMLRDPALLAPLAAYLAFVAAAVLLSRRILRPRP